MNQRFGVIAFVRGDAVADNGSFTIVSSVCSPRVPRPLAIPGSVLASASSGHSGGFLSSSGFTLRFKSKRVR